MGNYNPLKYDLGVVNADGVNYGMMLAQRNGVPAWAEYSDEYLANQFFTSAAGYASLPAEKELAIRQDDWRHGISDDIYDSSRPGGYYRSKDMDLRFKGMAISAYAPVAVAINTTGLLPRGIITNPGFEVNLGNWTLSNSELISRDTGNSFSGLGSLRMNAVPGTAWAYTQYPWNSQYQGQEFVASVRHRETGASQIEISIGDGVSTTSATNAANTAWQVLNVTKTLAAAATKLEINIATVGAGINVWFDDVSIAATNGFTGPPVKFIDYNDDLFMAHGSVLSNISASNTWTPIKRNFPGVITDLEVFPDGYLYIATNYFAPYFEMTAAQAFTQNNLYPYFRFFQVVHTASPTMWGSDSANQIRSTVAPRAGGTAWSGITNVGSAYHDITDMISYSGALYIMKENRPYYLDSTGAVQDDLAPELESLLRSTSGKNAFIWKNKIYAPCGEQGLLETDGTANRFLQPALYCQNIGDYKGRVQAVAGDEEYLFVAVSYGSQVEILAGRDETIDNTTLWIWHPIAEITLDGVETMIISTKIQKRLWIASTNSAQSCYYIPLPTGYGDITNDDNRKFQTNVFFETPWLHANFKDTLKAFPQLDVLMGHTYDADIFFQAHYKTLANSTYTFIANYKGSSTSMRQVNYLPLNPADQMIRLKFTANTDDATKTPKLLSYNLKGLLYPPRRTIIDCVVKVADVISLRDGTLDRSSDIAIKACLEAIGNPAITKWPVTIYDPDGNIRYVKLLPSKPFKVPVRDEKNQRTEWHYNLLLQEVSVG